MTVTDMISVRMGLSVIFLLGFLHLTVGQKECKNLKMFDGDSEVALSAYNCTQFSTDFCKNGKDSFPRNLSDGLSVSQPRDFNAPMYWEKFHYQGTDYLAAGIRYSWKMPIGGINRKCTKGFYLNMQPAGTGKVICFLFDLKNTNFTISTDFHFEYNSFPMLAGSYLVELFSLPPPSNDEYFNGLYERHVITIPEPQNLTKHPKPNSVDWKTWIQLHLHQEEGKVEVMFGYPGKYENANFTRYRLQLEEAGEMNPLYVHYFHQTGSDYGIYNFTKVPDGNYTVRKSTPLSTFFKANHTWKHYTNSFGLKTQRWAPSSGDRLLTHIRWWAFWQPLVKPEDDHKNVEGLCQCWVYVKGLNGLTSCGPCTSTFTPYFIFNSTIPPTSPSPSTGLSSTSLVTDIGNPGSVIHPPAVDGLSDGAIAAIIIGILVAVSIALLAGGYYFCRHRNHDDEAEKEAGKVDDNRNIVAHIGPEKGLKMPYISRKTVLLLASEDHKYFHQALQNFADFLELHCQCHVLFYPNRLNDIHKTASSYSWLSGQIDKADFVIIVNSEAAFRLYQAHQNNHIYKEADLGPEGDLFTPGIRHICGKISKNDDVSNVVMVHFGHTAPELCLPILALPHESYKLPAFLKSFLFHIHKLNENTMDLSKVNLPLQGNVEELKGGKAWLKAVDDCQAFESNDHNWFKRKFGEPISQLNKPSLSCQISKESGYFEAERDLGSFQRRPSSVSTHLQYPSDIDHLLDQGLINSGFTKDDFCPPSMVGDQSVYTIPYSSFTAAQSPPEIDRGSTTSDELRMFNEQYELDRAYEQEQGDVPQKVATGFTDLTRSPYILLQHPDAMMYQNGVHIEIPQHDSIPDCVSISSAQSV